MSIPAGPEAASQPPEVPFGPLAADLREAERAPLTPQEAVAAKMVEYAAWALRNNGGGLRMNALINPQVALGAFSELGGDKSGLAGMRYSDEARSDLINNALRLASASGRTPEQEEQYESYCRRLFLMSLMPPRGERVGGRDTERPGNENRTAFAYALVASLIERNMIHPDSVHALNRAHAPGSTINPEHVTLMMVPHPYRGPVTPPRPAIPSAPGRPASPPTPEIPTAREAVLTAISNLGRVRPSSAVIAALYGPTRPEFRPPEVLTPDKSLDALSTHVATEVAVVARQTGMQDIAALNRLIATPEQTDLRIDNPDVDLRRFTADQWAAAMLALTPLEWLKNDYARRMARAGTPLDPAIFHNMTRADLYVRTGVETWNLERIVCLLDNPPPEMRHSRAGAVGSALLRPLRGSRTWLGRSAAAASAPHLTRNPLNGITTLCVELATSKNRAATYRAEGSSPTVIAQSIAIENAIRRVLALHLGNTPPAMVRM